jgi:hypothetical protein
MHVLLSPSRVALLLARQETMLRELRWSGIASIPMAALLATFLHAVALIVFRETRRQDVGQSWFNVDVVWVATLNESGENSLPSRRETAHLHL